MQRWVRVHDFRKYLNAIDVLFPSFLLNENLLSLRRLSLTLGSSASRNKRFLLVRTRFVRSVIRDRLEQNLSVARIVYLRKPALSNSVRRWLYFVPIWVIDFIHSVVVRCANRQSILSLKRLAALAYSGPSLSLGTANSVLKSVSSKKSRVKSLSA
jgi:hypothetical protein